MKISRSGNNYVVEFTPDEYIHLSIGLDHAVDADTMPKNNGVHKDVQRMAEEIYKAMGVSVY